MRTSFGYLLALCLLSGCDDGSVNSANGWPYEDIPEQCDPGQRVLLSDLTNARDLGGVALDSGEHTSCGALFRGPPLTSASATFCEDVAALGIRAVIDLRTPEESSANPEAPCVSERLRVIAAPMPIPYNVSPADYIADLDAADSIAAAFAALADDSAYPLYFHCTWGRDRTGILAALVLSALGASREDILTEYSLSRYTVGAYPDSLRAALDEIERRGGIRAYLSSLGINAEQLAILKAHLSVSPAG